MSWMWAATGLQAAGSVLGFLGGSADNNAQKAWNEYNAMQERDTTFNNLIANYAITDANINASLMNADMMADVGLAMTEYNVDLIRETALYNDSLFEDELTKLWNSVGLDIELLEFQRARERGSIIAAQGASGTVIAEGTNEAVIVDQMYQENLDKMVIRYNADVSAGQISNARAQSAWEAEATARKMEYEGVLDATVTRVNANMAAIGARTQNEVQLDTGVISMNSRFQSAMHGASAQHATNQTQLSNGLVNGLFSAGSTAIAGYYANKTPSYNPSLSQVTQQTYGSGTAYTGLTPQLNQPLGGASGTLLA